ncbi:hypothetical protein PG993_004802 [Apiospora rasikravindrae]|uniref:FAD/NAD(P)-binding domain-containing protein n=1 Tax=Apiospora rasikravindrae TaxID=990691 RepID=A0ABR1TGJ2_9PEZI
MNSSSMYDVIIIGGGHAGMSAALTLYRHLHTCLIFDIAKPRNSWSLPSHSVSGWEGRQPEELRTTSRAELLATGLVTFVDSEATSLAHRSGGGFEITDSQGNTWTGRKLLIASGKQNIFPNIPGYAENYPEKIFDCMFTFGYEHRGSKDAGLLADGALSSPFHASMVVGDTRKFAERVTVYTNGDGILHDTMTTEIKHSGVTLDRRRISQIQRSGKGLTLDFEEGSPAEIEFLVHQPSTRVGLPFLAQLGVTVDERGDIRNIPPFFQTEVPGVFAAGDCASPFKIIPNAMLMGANAGAGIARSIAADNLSKEISLGTDSKLEG